MFKTTDVTENPWYLVDANNKRQARLNSIIRLLNQLPCEEVPREPVKFRKQQAKGD